MAQLVFQQLESIFDWQNFVDRKYNSRKLQEVVADCFGQVKAGIPKNAA